MKGTSHAAMGIAAGVLLAHHSAEPMLALALCSVGSLLPDLDHPRSIAGSLLPFVSWPVNKIIGHRSLTHSFLIVGLAVLFSWAYSTNLFPLALGYAVHLLGDACTIQGIPFLKRGHLGIPGFLRFRTGSVAETAIVLLFILAILVIYIWPTT